MMFLLLRRAPRALEGDSTEGTLLENVGIWISMKPMFHCLRLLHAQWYVGSVAGSSKRAYALSGGCPDRRQARITASAMVC